MKKLVLGLCLFVSHSVFATPTPAAQTNSVSSTQNSAASKPNNCRLPLKGSDPSGDSIKCKEQQDKLLEEIKKSLSPPPQNYIFEHKDNKKILYINQTDFYRIFKKNKSADLFNEDEQTEESSEFIFDETQFKNSDSVRNSEMCSIFKRHPSINFVDFINTDKSLKSNISITSSYSLLSYMYRYKKYGDSTYRVIKESFRQYLTCAVNFYTLEGLDLLLQNQAKVGLLPVYKELPQFYAYLLKKYKVTSSKKEKDNDAPFSCSLAIKTSEFENYKFLCSATLNGNSNLITASHCFADYGGRRYDYHSLKITCGSNTQTESIEAKLTEFNIQIYGENEINVGHSRLNPYSRKKYGDMAVLQLPAAFHFSFYSPVKISLNWKYNEHLLKRSSCKSYGKAILTSRNEYTYATPIQYTFRFMGNLVSKTGILNPGDSGGGLICYDKEKREYVQVGVNKSRIDKITRVFSNTAIRIEAIMQLVFEDISYLDYWIQEIPNLNFIQP